MCYKNEMAVSTPWGADGQILCLSIGRNRGKVTKVVVFATVGDGFQVFGISPVGVLAPGGNDHSGPGENRQL